MRFTLENFDVYLTFYIFAKTWNSKMHCFPIVLSLSETLIIHSLRHYCSKACFAMVL